MPLADELEARLARLGTRRRAVGAKAYLKSDLVFLGVDTPTMRAAVRDLARAHPLDHDTLVATVEALWARGIFELRTAAVELLVRERARLVAGDVPLVERLIREAGTWALVDELAPRVMASLVERFPRLARTLERWAKDRDFWIRRAALLVHLIPLREGGGDFARFGRYADAMLDEPEFFIRKAIGWVLRDTSRRRPELVFRWLAPRAHRASGVTMREATKYLSPAQAAELRARRAPPRAAPRRARARAAPPPAGRAPRARPPRRPRRSS